jgi:hypothetical protein
LQDATARRDEALADYGTRSPAERSKKLADANATAEKAVAGILDAKQNTRLKQIMLQQRGELVLEGGPNSPGASIFTEADIVAELKVSAEQQEKITAIVQNAVKVLDLIHRQHWGETPMPVDEHRTAVLERVRAVLTKEQREKWIAMLGEPFKGQRSPFGGGPPPDVSITRCGGPPDRTSLRGRHGPVTAANTPARTGARACFLGAGA